RRRGAGILLQHAAFRAVIEKRPRFDVCLERSSALPYYGVMSETLTAQLDAKRARLLEILRGMERVAVAFSGGIDSTVVAKAAFDVKVICSGANLDDRGDYRPGLKAAAEHAVRHPLQEAGFTKADVRALARAWDLPTWDKPASPCLSSRLAPGVEVTPERTGR